MGPIQNRRSSTGSRGSSRTPGGAGRSSPGAAPRAGGLLRPTDHRARHPRYARLVREEQFGPILPVLRYSHLDDAIARANDTEYGLAGSVWSADRERCSRWAARIEAGTVWVNNHLDMHPDTPFGGVKQSGVGVELGRDGLEEFTQTTIINAPK